MDVSLQRNIYAELSCRNHKHVLQPSWFPLPLLKGNRVVHSLHRNMAIRSYCCYLPCCQLERMARQGTEKGLFVCKATDPAALPLLEGFWLKTARRSQTASFNSCRDRNCRFRKAARMKVEIIPTVPSTATLSLGERTLAGRID